jgi:expansin (peptidoglycan-binding protein)
LIRFLISDFQFRFAASACYGYDTSGFLANNFIVAANSGLYNGGAACGQICQVSCYGDGCTSSNTISVKIVDLCPGCASDQLDLSEEAFSSIANTAQGVISINYSCS